MGKKAKPKKKKKNIKQKQRSMAELKKQFQIDDSVIVKPGVEDPDFGGDIGGWQGWVTHLSVGKDESTVTVSWDSVTLKNMPHDLILKSEESELSWREMTLKVDQVQKTGPRDEKADAQTAIKAIKEAHLNLAAGFDDEVDEDRDERPAILLHWDDQDLRLKAILGTDNEDDMDVTDENLKIYLQYLYDNLKIPLLVTGMEDFDWEEFYIFGPGDEEEYQRLKKTRPSFSDHFEIHSIELDDELDVRILAKVVRVSDNRKFKLPLDELEAVDKQSKDIQLLDDYSYWFVNFR